MYPTLNDGDELVIDQVSYKFMDPKRFDVIVFPSRYQDNTFYIKRVIGLPGETLQIINGSIYINGHLLEEKHGFEPIELAGVAANQVTLGADQYFVLGDNRNDSSDSRDPSFGYVTRSEILGKAFLRVSPLTSFGLVS